MLFLSWHMRRKTRKHRFTYSNTFDNETHVRTIKQLLMHMQRQKKNHFLSPSGHDAYKKKTHQLECIAKPNPQFLVPRHTYKKQNNY
jgi:hypothetical protein